jgi:hypothetical protein
MVQCNENDYKKLRTKTNTQSSKTSPRGLRIAGKTTDNRIKTNRDEMKILYKVSSVHRADSATCCRQCASWKTRGISP